MKRSFFALTYLMLFSAVTHAADSKTMLDQNGRTVVVPEKVDRIVSLVIPGASMVLTLDQNTDRLVGINPASKQEITLGLLSKFFPKYAEIPANMAGEGFAPNVEAIMRTNPDLVLQWGDKGEAIIKPMETMGLTVLTLKYGQTDYVATWLRLIGDVSGKSVRGHKLADWIMAEQTEMQQKLAGISNVQKPKVLYIHRYQGGILVGGQGSNMGYDINLAGGINVAQAAKGLAATSKEQIAAWNPDVVLLSSGEPSLLAQVLMDDPILSGIAAVKAGKVYKMPRGGFRWDPPSQETPLAWRWLAGLLHPNVYPLTDMRQCISTTYHDLYAQSVSESDIDHILNMNANGQRAGYAALKAGR